MKHTLRNSLVSETYKRYRRELYELQQTLVRDLAVAKQLPDVEVPADMVLTAPFRYSGRWRIELTQKDALRVAEALFESDEHLEGFDKERLDTGTAEAPVVLHPRPGWLQGRVPSIVVTDKRVKCRKVTKFVEQTQWVCEVEA